jgi:hypothetical protein
MPTTLDTLKFPIGKFNKPVVILEENITHWIEQIETFPQRLKAEVKDLSKEQLDTVYRPDGWTIRQVVHHCADSHMNSYTRFKLALTEDKPIIKPYYEERWAELADARSGPIDFSLQLLEGLHARWTIVLKSLTKEDLKRSFIHPEHGKELFLSENIGVYAWHCNHHLAHITELKKRNGWG